MKETEKLTITKSRELFEEATTLIPGGVLGARKPGDFIDGEYPIFLESGKGCHLMLTEIYLLIFSAVTALSSWVTVKKRWMKQFINR